MRNFLLAALAAVGLISVAYAQPFPAVPPGQTPANAALSQRDYNANSPPQGYQDSAVATGILGTGTTIGTATLLTARTNHVLCATGATAIQLPAVMHYVPVVVINRGTASCLVFPTTGDAVETAPGTVGAANAANTQAANTDVIYRPLIIAGATVWVQ